ncbi:hypothetical protein E4U43_007373 [Claviceps pusilla]|uniref:Uncharacterized protein n=1 Tax=Claviceps pusilla TaxID=123648 RepID=A0A9P7SZ57_9HYPO|nr:hypothetical protein E4U43_007373 [Claviceps pusilla]
MEGQNVRWVKKTEVKSEASSAPELATRRKTACVLGNERRERGEKGTRSKESTGSEMGQY